MRSTQPCVARHLQNGEGLRNEDGLNQMLQSWHLAIPDI
jgi:hypothetical protein